MAWTPPCLQPHQRLPGNRAGDQADLGHVRAWTRCPYVDASGVSGIGRREPVGAIVHRRPLLRAGPRAEGPDMRSRPRVPLSGAAQVPIVEDNIVNQKVLTAMVADIGYGADVACSGVDALEALDRNRHRGPHGLPDAGHGRVSNDHGAPDP